MTTPSGTKILIGLVVLIAMIALYTFLIMIIWNNVLMQKVKGADLQKIDFIQALAIAVFFSLVTGGTTVINNCQKD